MEDQAKVHNTHVDRSKWLMTGAPALVEALASLDCRVEEILERHTHAIVIGTVQAVRVGRKTSGLLHWRSRFETLD